LSSVTLSKSVKDIGSYAFSDCSALVDIIIPNSTQTIENDAFSGCTSLGSITLPNSVKTLGDESFLGCTSLSGLKFSTSVKTIGNSVFRNCTSLTNVALSGGVTSLGDYVFSGCTSLSEVTLPTKITEIGNYLFQGCSSLTSITIPTSVTDIGNYSFAESGLTGITIPSNVISIGAGAFLDCTNLLAVTISHKVTSIGYEAFAGCTALEGVFFMGNAPTSVDSDAFLGDNTLSVYYLPKTTNWSSTLEGEPTVLVTVPLIVQSPVSQSVAAGSTVEFTVTVFGPTTTKYQWDLNGKKISGTTDTLTLKSVQSKNAGTYVVIVSDSYGSVTSSPAILSLAVNSTGDSVVSQTAPTLTIAPTGNGVMVSWSSSATGWILQENTNLDSAGWGAASETIMDNGTLKYIIVNPSAGNQFYRLYSPRQ
jgi:hypothetical protein